jgi:hypothetical protein
MFQGKKPLRSDIIFQLKTKRLNLQFSVVLGPLVPLHMADADSIVTRAPIASTGRWGFSTSSKKSESLAISEKSLARLQNWSGYQQALKQTDEDRPKYTLDRLPEYRTPQATSAAAKIETECAGDSNASEIKALLVIGTTLGVEVIT